jgi:hypothetical protein
LKNSILGVLGIYPAGSRYASMAVHYTLREAATRLHPHFMQRPIKNISMQYILKIKVYLENINYKS